MTLTLTLDRVEVILLRICGRGLPTHQIRWKSEKLFVDVRTYGRTDVRTDVRTDGRTHLSSNLLGHRRGDDLIKKSGQLHLVNKRPKPTNPPVSFVTKSNLFWGTNIPSSIMLTRPVVASIPKRQSIRPGCRDRKSTVAQ